MFKTIVYRSLVSSVVLVCDGRRIDKRAADVFVITTSGCRGGLDRQRRFWREILILSKTRSATQTGIFCLYFVTGILKRLSFLLSMPRLKDVRNSLLIAHNNSLLSDEELLLLLDENSSENPPFNCEKHERFDIVDIEEAECKAEFRVEKK